MSEPNIVAISEECDAQPFKALPEKKNKVGRPKSPAKPEQPKAVAPPPPPPLPKTAKDAQEEKRVALRNKILKYKRSKVLGHLFEKFPIPAEKEAIGVMESTFAEMLAILQEEYTTALVHNYFFDLVGVAESVMVEYLEMSHAKDLQKHFEANKDEFEFELEEFRLEYSGYLQAPVWMRLLMKSAKMTKSYINEKKSEISNSEY